MSQADTPTETRNERAKRIMAHLLPDYHRGRENAISSSDLAEHTPVGASTLRDLIKEVQREYCIPIGSCRQGYYVVVDRQDYLRRIQSKRSEIQTHEETLAEFVTAWQHTEDNRRSGP